MGISIKQFGRLLDNALEAWKRYDIGSVKKKLDYETIKSKDLQVLEAHDRAMVGCSLEVANNLEMKRAATGKYEVRLTGDAKVSKTIAAWKDKEPLWVGVTPAHMMKWAKKNPGEAPSLHKQGTRRAFSNETEVKLAQMCIKI